MKKMMIKNLTAKRLFTAALSAVMLCAAAGCSNTNQINDEAAVPANAPAAQDSADNADNAGNSAPEADSAGENTEAGEAADASGDTTSMW